MPAIHPTASVSPDAKLADDVRIGPFTVIDGPVTLAAGVQIGGHAWISGHTHIAEACQIGWGSIIGADPQDLSFDPACDSGVIIGPRNTLREYVTIHRGSKPGTHTTLGEGNFLMTGVHLAHDVCLGDGNILANNVLLAGHVHVGNKAFLGGAAGFHQFVHIGDLAMIQGLTAVSQDVPPYCTAYGINTLAGLNTVGLRRAGFDSEERAAIKRAYQLIFHSGKLRADALAEADTLDWPAPARRFLDAIQSPSKKGIMSP
ncbi:MAG: acyl-ACP--UDP-N-acetylglucosamine O-acyltransferase [Verrucomicrobia bacterium]|nr:MAG: acyl-ACP--UDP-N-acetylglucosamine O-acyltransferase [Verrucomicrobiota bacterium]TAE88937.1 MAG: acyl-ACP--UDP-N-acetylglucosamine O-acyltransferase [Verrucomicrobiota bacterium]TAF27353.1 MAG: acyl-ACP--UDP-N-acetylglucosamine O-acyltransferase [Verrucomicrobiota bacterium]TAF42489.1 MAG: acyl-ACP--UDP-N-acetylglucosamine O-acyltransferase [Verrucomicrobiota bacterium]